ncbi:MFS transporter [Nonomuraea jabiensis]|uniref:MFS transporter n=1 Tax=Nonomuraea jabiensis TaxID=882448 RepID=UPI003F4DC1BE
MDIYGLLIAGFLVTMGTMGDRIGRKKLLLIGGAVFGIASEAAALSTSPQMLIASRALLSVVSALAGEHHSRHGHQEHRPSPEVLQ